MTIVSILINSTKLPKKEAVFALNRVSMRDTLVYLFLLFFICFLPNVLSVILAFEPNQAEVAYSQYLLTIIIFYPFFCLFLVISLVSIFAFGASLITWLVRRKLAYQQLWKMTSYALLWPIVIYQVFQFIHLSTVFATVISLTILYSLLFKMITIYPKRRNKNNHKSE